MFFCRFFCFKNFCHFCFVYFVLVRSQLLRNFVSVQTQKTNAFIYWDSWPQPNSQLYPVAALLAGWLVTSGFLFCSVFLANFFANLNKLEEVHNLKCVCWCLSRTTDIYWGFRCRFVKNILKNFMKSNFRLCLGVKT